MYFISVTYLLAHTLIYFLSRVCISLKLFRVVLVMHVWIHLNLIKVISERFQSHFSEYMLMILK